MADDVTTVAARTPSTPTTPTSRGATDTTTVRTTGPESNVGVPPGTPETDTPTWTIVDGVWVLGSRVDSLGRVVVSVGAIAEARRAVLESTARNAADQQLTCAALDALVPIAYGQPRLGALLANAMTSGNNWVFWLIWCEGEIDSIVSVTMNDEALPTGAIHDAYTGTMVQTVNIPLRDAFTANGVTGFNEPCLGLAYSVITVPFAAITSIPNFNAIVKGRKVYDPRTATTVWSDNPALIAADFAVNADLGAGLAIDWDSVHTCADFCDETVGVAPNTEKRRLSAMVVDRDATIDAWMETMRASGSFFIINNQGILKFVPDTDATPVASFSHSSGKIGSISNLMLRDATQLPTVIEVQYTDTGKLPWQTQSCDPVMRDGVDSGLVPYRKSVVAMPWITRASQAKREAIERLNKFWLRSISAEVTLFDEGLEPEPGDLISLTYPDAGFSSLPVRILNSTATEIGWKLTVEKHDVGAYSDVVQDVPTTPSTNLPSPDAPPVVTGLGVTEDVYQTQTGYWASRLRATWDDMTDAFPFASGYWVTISISGDTKQGPLVVPTNPVDPVTGKVAYVSPPLEENQTYTVSVRLASVTGALGDAATFNFTNSGKSAKPTPPTDLYAFEVGGETRISWTLGTDLDLTCTELRYGPIDGTWDTATLIDRLPTPSVRYNTKAIPAGTWRIWAKMRDSVRQVGSTLYPLGQESTTCNAGQLNCTDGAAYCDVIVTSDAAAFIAASYAFTTPLLSNMVAVADGWITSFGATWNATFTSAINSYNAKALLAYHADGASGLVTEAYDAGAVLTGDWSVGMTYSDLSGATPVPYIEVCADGAESGKAITTGGITNATPPVVNCAGHGYSNGDEIVISGTSNSAFNDKRFTVASATTDTFTLHDLFDRNVAAAGAATGGYAYRWVWQKFQAIRVKATARFVRARVMTGDASTNGTLYVTSLGSASCTVVARQEGGTVTTSATEPTIVTLAGHYNKAVSITGGLQGTVAGSWAYDNVEVDGARGVGVGESLLFNGSSDYVNIPDSTALRLATALTIEAQVKVSAVTGATQNILRKGGLTNPEYIYAMRIRSSGQFSAFYYNSVTPIEVLSSGTAPIGRWMHCAMTISGTTMSVYMDGILQGSVTITGTQGVPTGALGIGASAPSFTIGASWAEFFGGRIDDVRVWNVARTQAQIQAAMNTPLAGNESGLVGYWKFDSLTGTVATDSTANANHGTVSGAKWRPLNGFDLYAFNSAGAQDDLPLSWNFSGV